MSILPYPIPNYDLVGSFVLLFVSMMMTLFSPTGILFVIFSVLRGISKDSHIRKVSFVFQIVLICLSFFLGIVIGLLFWLSQNYNYMYNFTRIALPIFIGTGFVNLIGLGALLWQSYAKR